MNGDTDTITVGSVGLTTKNISLQNLRIGFLDVLRSHYNFNLN